MEKRVTEPASCSALFGRFYMTWHVQETVVQKSRPTATHPGQAADSVLLVWLQLLPVEFYVLAGSYMLHRQLLGRLRHGAASAVGCGEPEADMQLRPSHILGRWKKE